MATISDRFCDICASRDVSNLAIQWCPECEQGLCKACIDHHTGFKLFKNHVTIDITNYKKLPDSISSIKLLCEEHNEKFQLFCPSHGVPCCGQCVSTSHTDCKGLLAMAEIVKNAKTSSALDDVEEILNATRKNIEIIVKDRAQNLKDVQRQFQNAKVAVKETRQAIISTLDRLERNLLDEIRNKEFQIRTKTEYIINEMKDKNSKIQEYQENIKTIKEYGTDIQTFFGTRAMAAYVQDEEQRINVYFEDGTLNATKIQFKLHQNLDKFLTTKTLGSLLLETTQSAVKRVQTKVRAAQIGSSISRIQSAEAIKVKIYTRFRISPGKRAMQINGCDITRGGKLMFADCENNRVIIHTIDGNYLGEVCTSILAIDVSVIDEENVALSSARECTVQILNTSTNEIIKTIKTSHNCRGVAYSDGKIISAIYSKGIISYDTGANLATLIRKDALPYNSYVTCFQGRIYYTNKDNNSITCLNQEGKVLRKFIDNSLLQNPRSIATDQHGNVFVSSLDNNSIVAISPDGKHGRVILTNKDGIKNAWAMCYDKLRDKLVVANYSGDVFVFDIQ